MDRTVVEACFQGQPDLERTVTGQRTRDANVSQGGSGVGKVIDLSLAGQGNFVAKRGFLIEMVWFLIEAIRCRAYASGCYGDSARASVRVAACSTRFA
jgi:putative colanic acid biosynthesis acetyltransferase WcaF